MREAATQGKGAARGKGKMFHIWKHFCTFAFVTQLSKPIKIRLLSEAQDYFDQLNEKVQMKFLLSFDKTQFGLKGDWLEPIKNSQGIWEFRQRDHEKFYRILAFWDTSESVETLILATHGFYKKTNKTPFREIHKAEQIKQEYFKRKK